MRLGLMETTDDGRRTATLLGAGALRLAGHRGCRNRRSQRLDAEAARRGTARKAVINKALVEWSDEQRERASRISGWFIPEVAGVGVPSPAADSRLGKL